MERTRNIPNRKPDFILCSDFHLREDTPTCWISPEAFFIEQWNSVDFVSNLVRKYDCFVIHAGDLFNHWKPSPWLITMALRHLPQKFYTIYGQHDIPEHNLQLTEKCGIDTLKEAGKIHVLPYTHYGQEPDMGLEIPFIKQNILVWHHMTYITPPFPGATGGQALGILRKYPQFDLIVTGDNHQSFSELYLARKGGIHSLLVNPGSLTRQTVDQIDFQPRVALWYAETNTIEWVNIPIAKNMITREHIGRKEKRDARIEAFVNKLGGTWDIGLSFEQNLKECFATNKIKEPVKKIIFKAIE